MLYRLSYAGFNIECDLTVLLTSNLTAIELHMNSNIWKELTGGQ